MTKQIILYDSAYFSMFDDGTFGHSDGVGYVGETDADEVRALYEVMKVFFENRQPVSDEPVPGGLT